MEQKLSVYPGTPQSEIISSILTILHLETAQFLYSEGSPLVLSSYMPTGTQIFVSVPKAVVLPKQVNWKWHTPINPQTDEDSTTHFLKDSDLTVYQPSNESSCGTYGTVKFSSGEKYWTLRIDPLQCCVEAGVLAANKSNWSKLLGEKTCFWTLFEKEGHDPHGTFPGPTIEAGFYLNMIDTPHTLTVTDHETKKVLARVNIPYSEVYPAVFFKHVVSISITGTDLAIPTWVRGPVLEIPSKNNNDDNNESNNDDNNESNNDDDDDNNRPNDDDTTGSNNDDDSGSNKS